jgi:predicted phage tail protein
MLDQRNGFTLERATSSAGPYTTIASTGVNVTAFSSTGLAGSTTYYFRVRAFNTSGSSAYAPVASATTTASVTVPTAPSGVTATAASSSQINLSWVDNSTNEQGFSIERATSSSGPWSAIGTSTLPSYASTALAVSTTYYYRVAPTPAGYRHTPIAAQRRGVHTPPPFSLTATGVSSNQINQVGQARRAWVERGISTTGP